MPQSVLDAFTAEYGVKIKYLVYESQEEAIANIEAGQIYDVAVMESRFIPQLAQKDLLAELHHDHLSNLKNISASFRELAYDPDNKYSVPYQWGTTGILYNKKELGTLEPSWEPMWDPATKGKIGMLNDERETPGAALYKLGYSVNTKDQEQLDEAEAELIKQKPLLRGYFDSTQNRPLVINGDLLLGHVFSGDAFLAMSSHDDLDYIIPEPAATQWTDNMAIPKGAEHPENAHKFINYILGAKAGAALSNYTYYNTPNEAALPMIASALKTT